VFGTVKDGELQPFGDKSKLFYLSTNQNLLFDDIKLKYDVSWVVARNEYF